MTRGRSKKDKTYTATHGGDGPSSSVHQLRAMERKPVSIQDRLVGPSQTEMLRAISNGQCPFCGREFKNIAAHTNRTHGIDRFQLKDMLGIPKTHSVCTPELRDKLAEKSRKFLADNPDIKAKLRPTGNRRSFSIGGREVQRQKANSLSREQIEAIGRKNSESRREATKDRDQTIIDMVNSGAGMDDIREATGAGNTVIKNAMKFYGIDVDLRTRRKIYSTPEQIRQANQVRLGNLERQADERIALWKQLGANRNALRQCAAAWGLGTKESATWLRKHGQMVPDGRAGTPLNPAECGTSKNYRKHRRDGEKPCRTCQDDENRRHVIYINNRKSNT